MREILFRGKRMDNGEWVYGSVLEQFNGLYGVDGFISLYDKAKCKMQTYEVYCETVGQYTGLKDKNGKRIFEGDILKWDSMEWGCNYLEIANWDYELFDMRKNDWKEWCEVIGNIHDNPELLEK